MKKTCEICRKRIFGIQKQIKETFFEDNLTYSEWVHQKCFFYRRKDLMLQLKEKSQSNDRTIRFDKDTDDLVEVTAGKISDCFELETDMSFGGHLQCLVTDEGKLRREIRKLLQGRGGINDLLRM